MKLGVVGSRHFTDYDLLSRVLEQYTDIEEIISGGAKGADLLARRYADEHGIPMKEYLPDWDKYGRAAGPIRNKLIVERADLIVAFLADGSRGTRSTINIAKKTGKDVDIIPI